MSETNQGDGPVVLTDAGGRKLTLRTLKLLDQIKVLRAIGPAQSSNEPYVNTVQAVCMIAEIDGVPVAIPANETQIDGLLTRVGTDGATAVTVHLNALMREAVAKAEGAMSETL